MNLQCTAGLHVEHSQEETYTAVLQADYEPPIPDNYSKKTQSSRRRPSSSGREQTPQPSVTTQISVPLFPIYRSVSFSENQTTARKNQKWSARPLCPEESNRSKHGFKARGTCILAPPVCTIFHEILQKSCSCTLERCSWRLTVASPASPRPQALCSNLV